LVFKATAANGVRAISVDRGSLASAFGVFVGSGSRDEPEALTGATHFLSSMFLQATEKRVTPVRAIRDAEFLGTKPLATAGRDYVSFTGEGIRDDIEGIVELILDLALNGKYHFWEVNDAKSFYEQDIASKNEVPHDALGAAIHHAAYGDSTLGKSLTASPQSLEHFLEEGVLADFRNSLFDPSKIVIAGVDIPEDVMKNVLDSLSHLQTPANPLPPRETAQYLGGDMKIPVRSASSLSLFIGFGAPGVDAGADAPLCILNMLMGGGGAFSAGGPGKGMYSRLYRSVLNRHYWIENVNSSLSLYKDSSVFGIQADCDGAHGSHLAEVLVSELKAMKTLSEAELSRAKNLLKTNVFMNLETRNTQLEDLGRTTLLSGSYPSEEELLKKIDGVSMSQVQDIVSKMLTQTPTVASIGAVEKVPPHHAIARRFK